MPDNQNILTVPTAPLCNGQSAGLFISSGCGLHPTRVTDFHEIIVVRSGVLGIFEQSHNFEVQPGQALHLFPGRKHGGTLTYRKDLSFYWLHFSSPQKSESASCLKIPQLVTLPSPQRVYELLHRYISDIETQRDDEYLRSLIVMMILREIATAGKVLPTDQASRHLAHRAMEYIATNYTRPISTADVAEHLSCNGDYITRLFKQVYHVSPVAAINARRIVRAKQLLVSSPDNIDQISASCGYSSAAYMRKVFAKNTGMTPSQYRKQFSRVRFNVE